MILMRKIQRQYLILSVLLLAGAVGSLLTPLNVDPRIGTFSAGLTIGVLIAIYMLRIAELGDTRPDEDVFLDFHNPPNAPVDENPLSPPDSSSSPPGDPTGPGVTATSITPTVPGSPGIPSTPSITTTTTSLGVPDEHSEPEADGETGDMNGLSDQDAYRESVVEISDQGERSLDEVQIDQPPATEPEPTEIAQSNNILNFDPAEEEKTVPAAQPVAPPELAFEDRCACACGCDRRSRGGLTDLCGSCIRWWQQQSMRCKCDYTVNQYCTCGAIRHGLRVSDDVSEAA